MTLKVTLPICYPVRCLLKRGRNERVIHLHDTAEVEIPQVSRSDLDEVVRVTTENRNSPPKVFSRLAFEDETYARNAGVSTYMVGEDRWARAVDQVDATFLTGINHVEVTRQLIDGPHGFGKSPWGYPREIKDMLPLNVDTVLHSRRDKVQASVKRLFSEMLLVDGCLYQRRGAPMLHVSHPEAGYSHISIDESWVKGSTLFAVIHEAEARAFGRAFAKRSRGDIMFDSYLTAVRCEVFDHERVKPLFERERNAEALAFRFTSMVGNNLNCLPPEGFDAMGRLSRLVQLAKANDPEAADAVLVEVEMIMGSKLLKSYPVEKREAIRREVEIGLEGIRVSPKSPVMPAVLAETDDWLTAIEL